MERTSCLHLPLEVIEAASRQGPHPIEHVVGLEQLGLEQAASEIVEVPHTAEQESVSTIARAHHQRPLPGQRRSTPHPH